MPISLSGSLVLTGSITTTGGITISGSILSASYSATASFSNDFTVLGNLTVFGTQSVQYITSSQLNVSDNVITVNVASPGVRFGGLSVFDSGSLSSESTASLFWDSQENHWIYQRESGSTYNGGMLISGPRNSAGLGNESGTTSCMLLVGQGGDHLTSSLVYHDSVRTCVPSCLVVGGALNGTSATFNTQLKVSNPTGTTLDMLVLETGFNNPSGNKSIIWKDATNALGRISVSYDASTGSTMRFGSLYNGGYQTSDLMTITKDGNVGIGISPSYKLDINNGASGVVLNLEGTNAYGAETGILMSAGRAKISGFLETGGGTPGTSLRFYTMPNEGSITERMRITSAGNVGIGTNSPGSILDIKGTGTYDFIKISNGSSSGGGGFLSYQNTTASSWFGNSGGWEGGTSNDTGIGSYAGGIRFYTNGGTEKMRITCAGRVGIGVTNPESLLDVADSTSNTLMLVKNTSTANTTGKNAMYGFGGTDTVGTPKAVGGMQAVPNDVNWVNGLLYWYVRAGDGQALRMSLSSGGALTISGALTQNGSPSDINLKENLVKIPSALEKISQINGYTFDWKEGSPARGCISNIVQDAGIIAQEIETILPEIVRTSDDNKVVNYNGLVALLIEGMKEQQCIINTLKTCIGI